MNSTSLTKQCKLILTSIGYKDDKKKWQIGKTKVFMKEEVRQVLERELGNAFTEHACVIQKAFK